MIHTSTERLVPYSIAPLFGLIADIESYPLYMPGFRAARVLERTATCWRVQQTVSFVGLQATFISMVELDPPKRLEIRASETPIRSFSLVWILTPRAAEKTLIRAELDLAFRSMVLEGLAMHILPLTLERAMAAFEQRAPSLLSQARGGAARFHLRAKAGPHPEARPHRDRRERHRSWHL